MISRPRAGQRVKVWYRKSMSHLPLHGRVGVVTVAGKGRPRNHGLIIDGVRYIIPAGNLQPVKDE